MGSDSNTEIIYQLNGCARDLEHCLYILARSNAVSEDRAIDIRCPESTSDASMPGWIWGVLGGSVLVSFLVGFVVGLK